MATDPADWKAARLARLREDPGDPCHGRLSGYNYGCRCEACRAAQVEYAATRFVGADERQKERLAALMEAARPRIVRVHGVGEVEI